MSHLNKAEATTAAPLQIEDKRDLGTASVGSGSPDNPVRQAGVWDERNKQFITASGTVKQGRRPMFQPFSGGGEESRPAHNLPSDERKPLADGSGSSAPPSRKTFRDYEPEAKHGTAHDIQEHIRYGGKLEDY